MAAMLRLLAELIEADDVPDEVAPGVDGFRERSIDAMRAASGVGDQDETVDAQRTEETIAALEAAGDAAADLANALNEDGSLGYVPRAGQKVDDVLTGLQPWADRLDRATDQLKSLAKPVGVLAGGATTAGLALKVALAGPIATLNWVLTVIRHVWPG